MYHLLNTKISSAAVITGLITKKQGNVGSVYNARLMTDIGR